MQVLRQLAEELHRRNVGLVVLDSVAMLARLEYDSRQVVTRQKLLAEQASLLKQAAERFCIPVVVTNQVTGGESGEAGQQRAALGVVWAHAVNTRLVMDQQAGVRRVRVRFNTTGDDDVIALS
jgi:RAD51-like protein 1